MVRICEDCMTLPLLNRPEVTLSGHSSQVAALVPDSNGANLADAGIAYKMVVKNIVGKAMPEGHYLRALGRTIPANPDFLV